VLSHWDLTESVHANLQRLRRENVFGKASRSWVEDIVAIFRQRYLGEPSVTHALVTLVTERLPAAALDRILYFHAARADRLLHDVVTEILVPKNTRSHNDLRERRWLAEAWPAIVLRRRFTYSPVIASLETLHPVH
jgi:hypothetical protein